MKILLAFLVLLLPLAALAEQSTGQRIKSDAKAAARQTRDAAVDVGHQIRDGTKKAYRSGKAKVKSDAKDVKAGRQPGDGHYAKRNEARAKAQQGRE